MKKYNKYLIALFIILGILISICFVPINGAKFIPAIETQVSQELGIKVHIEKLILRLGPQLKVKAPIMHLLYEDGHKFGQFDGVKFYLPLFNLGKNKLVISKIHANKLIVKTSSDDIGLDKLLNTINKRDIKETPNVYLKQYNISHTDKAQNDKYSFSGNELDVAKVKGYKNFKVVTKGNFAINNKQHFSYDLVLNPKFDLSKEFIEFDYRNIVEQLKLLNFNSDIIADLKLYKNASDLMQASGFINIDNISILDDNEKKNPKSFIYMTLWGDKASILSNIYTSVNKKIYLEGMINNSTKPYLDLKVKTDDILLSDLYRKIKVFSNFSGLKNIKSINGSMNANFTLKGDLNKIKSNGFLKISNANVLTNGFKVDEINSEIDFSNNKINIVKAVGYINKSPIYLKGDIDKNLNLEILMDKVELQHLFPETYGVKSGIASLVAHISGTLNNVIHKENLQVNNLKIEQEKYGILVDSIKYDTNKNNNAYISNIQFNNNITETIKIPSLRINIDNDIIKILETNIFLPNSKFILKADANNVNRQNLGFNIDFVGDLNVKDLKKYSNISKKYPIKLNINGNKASQNINGLFLIEEAGIFDEPSAINLAMKLEKNSLRIDELALIPTVGKVVSDLKNNSKYNRKIMISGNVENFAEPVFKNIRIFIPQQINIHLSELLAQLKGDIFINGKIESPEIVGQINLTNLINQNIQLVLSNCILDFNKNIINVSAPQVKLSDSSFSLISNISSNISDGIIVKNLNIKSKYLNTDTLLMYKDLIQNQRIPLIIEGGKFYSEKLLASIYGNNIYLTGFSSDLKMKDNILNLENVTSEIFNGKLAGNIDYNLRDEHFDSKILARGVSASPIFDIVSTRKDSISGTMDFDTSLKGELTSKQSLNGDIKFIVHNGRMSTLGKVEHLLYAQNVVADNMLRTSFNVVAKALTLKDTGLFKFLRGEIDLKDGIANIKNLQSQGPLMSLYIKGLYNTTNDDAKLVVLGRLSDEVISGLGAFGDFSLNKLMIMLTGEEPKYNQFVEDFEKIPQLPMKNTKEFRSIISGIVDKPSSVINFNWISYSQKTLRQKEVPMNDIKVPDFVNKLPY